MRWGDPYSKDAVNTRFHRGAALPYPPSLTAVGLLSGGQADTDDSVGRPAHCPQITGVIGRTGLSCYITASRDAADGQGAVHAESRGTGDIIAQDIFHKISNLRLDGLRGLGAGGKSTAVPDELVMLSTIYSGTRTPLLTSVP